MKKRLLSFLLVMAMLLSMVPFQAFAEEADVATELPEAVSVETTVPETTEETVPETTVEIVPETTVEIVPETTEETVPETTEETVLETTEETIPEVLEEDTEGISPDAEDSLPQILLVGMDTPVKKLRVGDTFQLQAKLTEDSKINDGIEWILQEDPDGYAIDVTPEGLVTVKEDFEFSEMARYFGFANDIIVRQAVRNGETPAYADTTVTIIAFPTLELVMSLDGILFNDSRTVNISDGIQSFMLTASPVDCGPFGGATLTITDKKKIVTAEKSTEYSKQYDCYTEAYTVTPKKAGSFTITATSKDDPAITASATINVFIEPDYFYIKHPSSVRTYKDEQGECVLLTAGQKLPLSVALPKDAVYKDITWEIIPAFTWDPDNPELPHGAAASGDELSSLATIDQNGVLRTYAGVISEYRFIYVRAILTPTIANAEPIGSLLFVGIQPPVESFSVKVEAIDGHYFAGEESSDGAVNRKDNDPWDWNIHDGSFVLKAHEFLPDVEFPEVKWNIKVSSKTATVQTPAEFFGDTAYDEDWFENTMIVTPEAPGRLTFTATSTDGSGARYSGSVVIYGDVKDVTIGAEKYETGTVLRPGDKVQFTGAAFYDNDRQCPISGAKFSWQVFDDSLNATDFATISSKGLLTITRNVSKTTELVIRGTYDGREAEARVLVEPANEKTLALADVTIDAESKACYSPLNTSDCRYFVPGDGAQLTIAPVWLDKQGGIVYEEDGTTPVPVTGFTYKVSGSGFSFDKSTGTLTCKKAGTAKITATCAGQSVTNTFRGLYPSTSVTIKKPADGVITVVGGKSVTLKATGWYDAKTKATDQKFQWKIDEDQFKKDYYGRDVDDFFRINRDTGKLITDKVYQDFHITVNAYCGGADLGEAVPGDSVTIHIIPSTTRYTSRARVGNNGYFRLTGQDDTLEINKHFVYGVESYGLGVPSRITDVTSSNPRIAVVEKDSEGHITGIKIPATAKPGKATITVKGQVLDGYDGDGKEIWKNAPSAKFTMIAVRPVTSIEITRPEDKAGSDLPLYVGKSLKLSAKVNDDATNKKLVWHVSCESPDYYEEEYLEYGDKTTISNGVLKVDKSYLTNSRTYYVWATSEDGFAESNVLEIQAYAMTGAIHIESYGEWTDYKENYRQYLNNRTITIRRNEILGFGAYVTDVNGDEGANPDVTWSVSGKNGIVAVKDGLAEKDGIVLDCMAVKGLKPGTVTIKVSAKDGSGKSTTFKLVVE